MSRDVQHPFDSVVVYHGAESAKRGWWLVLCATALTLALFAVLPFTEIAAGVRDEALSLSPVNTVDLRIPPPPASELPPREFVPEEPKTTVPPEIEPPPPVMEEPSPPRPVLDAPAPRLATDTPRLPLASLRLGLPGVRADIGVPYRFELGTTFREAAAVLPPVAEEPPVPEVSAATHSVEDVDTPPKPLSRTQPVYPLRARSRGVEGYAIVRFTVTADGAIENVLVVASEPARTFVAAACAAVQRWRFEPGIKDGRTVATAMQVKLEFRLN